MRALFTTQPGFGHLNPFLSYAVALREAGHEVLFASSASFAEAIERHGFQCEPIGVDFTWENVFASFPTFRDAVRTGRRDEFAAFDITWGHWNPNAARDLLALLGRWQPSVIVRELAENGATFAGEMTGVPVVCATWGAPPFDPTSWQLMLDWDRHLACYAATRSALGLSADDPGGVWRRQPTLTPFAPSWFRRLEPGVVTQHFRVPPTEAPVDIAPPWLANLGEDRPLVYATLGTVYNKMRRPRAAMLEAMADLDADVLMTVGRDVDPAGIGMVPANVRLEPFVPQSLVLGRVSLAVSHAGLGTMLGAIYHGVPMVVVAIGADQPVNAGAPPNSASRSHRATTRSPRRGYMRPPRLHCAMAAFARPPMRSATNATRWSRSTTRSPRSSRLPAQDHLSHEAARWPARVPPVQTCLSGAARTPDLRRERCALGPDPPSGRSLSSQTGRAAHERIGDQGMAGGREHWTSPKSKRFRISIEGEATGIIELWRRDPMRLTPVLRYARIGLGDRKEEPSWAE